jgi:flagellar hook protein FlgE
MSAISTSSNGMVAAFRQLDASAMRVAQIATDETDRPKVDKAKVDPIAETAAQITARQEFAANAAVLRTSSSMLKRALDIAV